MNDLSEIVEKEIEARGMSPRPRWHFLLKRSVLWSLAVSSILIGAVSYSVANYVFFDNEGLSPSVLLDTPLEVIVQNVPFIWLLLFGLFCVATYVGLRNTRSGYKYQTAGVVLAVLVATISLGQALNYFDFGQAVHRYLLNNTAFYDMLIHSSEDLKQ